MQNNNSISFLIPLYNCAAYIERCVQSVVNQKIDDYEIVVVDDGSTDGGGDIVAEIQKTNPNIRLIRQANAGVSRARNVALEVATGEYIYFVDADDLLIDNSIKPQLKLMRQHNLDALKVNFCYADDSNYITQMIAKKSDAAHVSDIFSGVDYLQNTNLLWSTNLVGVTVYIYRRELFINHDLRFDENLKICEDYIFNIKALIQTNRVAVTSSTVYVYMRYANSCSHARRPYAEVSEIGLNLYGAFSSLCYENRELFYNLNPVIEAYADKIVFAYILWPMIREAAPLSVCKSMIKELKKRHCYPIKKPSHIENTNFRYNRILNALWHLSRYYPLWMMAVMIQRIARMRITKHRASIR
jgi:glycosyltransferase involved in cell wall biosynthesis